MHYCVHYTLGPHISHSSLYYLDIPLIKLQVNVYVQINIISLYLKSIEQFRRRCASMYVDRQSNSYMVHKICLQGYNKCTCWCTQPLVSYSTFMFFHWIISNLVTASISLNLKLRILKKSYLDLHLEIDSIKGWFE